MKNTLLLILFYAFYLTAAEKEKRSDLDELDTLLTDLQGKPLTFSGGSKKTLPQTLQESQALQAECEALLVELNGMFPPEYASPPPAPDQHTPRAVLLDSRGLPEHPLKIVKEEETFTIYHHTASGKKTFSLHLSCLPDGNDTIMRRTDEATKYLTDRNPKTGLTYAIIAQWGAFITTAEFGKEKNKEKIQRSLVKARQNITLYRKNYYLLLAALANPSQRRQAKKLKHKLKKQEYDPETRPNPLIIHFLEQRLNLITLNEITATIDSDGEEEEWV